LQRHDRTKDRPAAAGVPRLLVLSPAATDDADGGWLAGALNRTRNIYRWTILWRSARVLFDAGTITAPGDVRRMVEAVYGDEDDVPAGLSAALARETGAESAALSMAQMNVLRWQDGYARGSGWDSDIRTPTRLSEASAMFRLARWENGALSPFYADPTQFRAWALSEISLARWRAADVPQPTGALASAVAAAKAAWGRWDQDVPLLVLEPSGDGWERPVRYDSTFGLVML
jgi:CRISPR-associated endonuclease/helicase Cas3